MINIFSGYIPSSGKIPLHSVKTFNAFKEPPSDGDYVGVLKPDIIQVDCDDKELSDKILEIVQGENLRCNILKTTRGLHFYFKNTTVSTQRVHYYSACGIPCDYGLGCKDRVVPLKITTKEVTKTIQNGETCENIKYVTKTRDWLQVCDELDDLPNWLYPVSKNNLDITDTETRNNTLFTYILMLQRRSFSKEEIVGILNIINEYIFDEPLSEKEMEQITREDAFCTELFFNEKGVFQHDVFGNYMIANCNIINIDGQCNIYTKSGLYTNDPNEFEKVMLDKISFLKDNQRKEVYKYISLRCTKHGKIANPKYIGMKDFILDIETNEEIEYNPRLIINNKIPWNYKDSSYSEVMDKTLNKVCCNDKQIRMLLEEMIGYSLYRANNMQTCFILTGEGSNGKSTILNIIKTLIGKHNYTSLDLRELEDTFKPSELYNKLANLGDDISSKYLDSSSIFKKLVTGEAVMVQKKYAQPFELESYATQIFCANEMPNCSDKTDGFSRRLTIVPFNARFSSSDVDFDPFIESKLLSDDSIEYVLKLAVNGLKRLLENNKFTKSDVGQSQKDEYLISNNNILEWMEEEPKIENETPNDVYMQYKVWCSVNGCMPNKKGNLTKHIKRLGYISIPKRINGKVVRVYGKE